MPGSPIADVQCRLFHCRVIRTHVLLLTSDYFAVCNETVDFRMQSDYLQISDPNFLEAQKNVSVIFGVVLYDSSYWFLDCFFYINIAVI